MRQFLALETFESPEVKSTYTEGLSYTIVDNNKILNALAEVWALQGKIVFIHNPSMVSRMQGSGKVATSFWGMTKAAWRSLWQ